MSLRVLDAEPIGADVVEALRTALDKAEAGELSSVAIAVVYRDGVTGRFISKPPSLGLLLGSVTRLAHLISRQMD